MLVNLPKKVLKYEKKVVADSQDKTDGETEDSVSDRTESLDENSSNKSENSEYGEAISFKMEFEVDNESAVNLKPIKNEKLETENTLDCEDLTVRRKAVNVFTNCQICEYSTRHRMNLERHYISHFGDEINTLLERVASDLKCSLCSHESKSKVDMKYHLALPHRYLNKILQAKGFEAFIKQKKKRRTGKIRKAKIIEAATAAIKKHSFSAQKAESPPNDKNIKSIEQVPEISSDISKSVLIETLSTKRHFECDQCSKTFGRRGSLLVHKKLHGGIKPYKCNYCNHTSSHKGNLKVHVNRRHRYE